jgi:hypothetical protein
MKMKLLLPLLTTIILLAGCKKEDDLIVPVNTVVYDITVTTMWSSASHPVNYPSNAHFSPIIGMSHNMNVSLYSLGQLATEGIKVMAESGKPDLLNAEIDDYISKGTATLRANGGGISTGSGSSTISLHVNSFFPLISVVSMIAPSPDWFIGVNNISLLNNGAFVNDTIITMYSYDAGTDSGVSFTSANEATTPPDSIFKIITPPLGNGTEIKPALATIRFKRRN